MPQRCEFEGADCPCYGKFESRECHLILYLINEHAYTQEAAKGFCDTLFADSYVITDDTA